MEEKELDGLGDKIYDLRRLNELSQDELAKRVGVSRQTVMKWESGLIQPKSDKLRLICKALGVGVEYLMPRDGVLEEDAESDSEDDDSDQVVCDEAEESLPQAEQETPIKKSKLSKKVKIIISSIVLSICSLFGLSMVLIDKLTGKPSEGGSEMVESIAWNFNLENIGWAVFSLAISTTVILGIILICRYVINKRRIKKQILNDVQS